MITAPEQVGVEQIVLNLVLWLKLIVESLGALIIGSGLLVAASVFIRTFLSHRPQSYDRIRLTFARFLALALEFQLAADILSTAVAPSWEQIGKLAAIAIIRTALNYFLTREMREEQAGIAGDRPAAPQQSAPWNLHSRLGMPLAPEGEGEASAPEDAGFQERRPT